MNKMNIIKMLLFLFFAVISYYGGVFLATVLFGPLTGPDEVVTGCVMLMAGLIWFIRQVVKLHFEEAAAARLAAYEARRDAKFKEKIDEGRMEI